VSFKREKPPPRVAGRYGKQDQNIQDFLKIRKTVNKIKKNCCARANKYDGNLFAGVAVAHACALPPCYWVLGFWDKTLPPNRDALDSRVTFSLVFSLSATV